MQLLIEIPDPAFCALAVVIILLSLLLCLWGAYLYKSKKKDESPRWKSDNPHANALITRIQQANTKKYLFTIVGKDCERFFIHEGKDLPAKEKRYYRDLFQVYINNQVAVIDQRIRGIIKENHY